MLPGLALVLAAGCGGGDTHPVSGRVVFDDGEPMESGFVLFKPAKGGPSRGVVTDGSYQLSTLGENDGAPAGSYKVAIIPDTPGDYDPDSGKGFVPKAPQQYFSPETSGLTFEVKPGKNQADFTIPVAKGYRPVE